MLGKKILFSSADEHGCGWYRTKLIADYLQEEQVWFFPAHKDNDGNLTLQDERIFNSDVIVLQRHNHEFFLHIIPHLQSLGKKIVYDIDDNLWNISVSNPAHVYFPTKDLKRTKEVIKLCDYMTVSTQPLKDWFINNGFHTKIEVIPNMLPEVYDYKERNNEKIRIGYAGSPTHVGDFNYRVTNALKDVQEKYNCDLVFMGYAPIKDVEYCDGVKVQDYLSTLNDLNLDIAIAPLASNLFNECKSNLKFLEYSACGFVTVASNVYPYKNTINEQTGIVIENEKHWFSTLETLVKDRELRNILSWNAHSYVDENFTYKNAGHLVKSRWEGIIRDMYDIH